MVTPVPDAERAPSETRPVPVIVQVPTSRSALGTVLQVISLLVLLALLGVTAAVALSVASLVGMPGQVVGGLGERAGTAVSQASRAVGDASDALRNAADPAAPPSNLTYDTELSALTVLDVGQTLPGSSDYVLTVSEVRRRDGATSPDTALYAVVHAELRQPRETRILGQVVRSDRDPHDHPIYKGESFRVGRQIYRVNWVSLESHQVALAAYRHPDQALGTLKFTYD